MNEIRERVGNERRRLKKVREALSASLVKTAEGDASYVPFYVAIGNYFEIAMDRLDVQDVRMEEMLKEMIPDPDETVKKAFREVEERLRINREHLKKFMAARDALKEKGAAALSDFEAAAKAYTDFILAQMGHHGASTSLAGERFSQKEWEFMAHIEQGDMEREQKLFDEVFAAQPAALRDQAAG